MPGLKACITTTWLWSYIFIFPNSSQIWPLSTYFSLNTHTQACKEFIGQLLQITRPALECAWCTQSHSTEEDWFSLSTLESSVIRRISFFVWGFCLAGTCTDLVCSVTVSVSSHVHQPCCVYKILLSLSHVPPRALTIFLIPFSHRFLRLGRKAVKKKKNYSWMLQGLALWVSASVSLSTCQPCISVLIAIYFKKYGGHECLQRRPGKTRNINQEGSSPHVEEIYRRLGTDAVNNPVTFPIGRARPHPNSQCLSQTLPL